MSWFTDQTPFSFWVRPAIMEPMFGSLTAAGVDSTSAAAAAVLAGHFMIWGGPATTMYQRKFIPDWITAAFIQPLGLFEDVAIVLATWAASDPHNKVSAEIGLYLFMLAMNVANYVGSEAKSCKSKLEHFIVFLIVLAALAFTYTNSLVPSHAQWKPDVVTTATTTTTTTPLIIDGMVCTQEHTDVKTMAAIVVKVSVVAFVSRYIARLCTCCMRQDDSHKASLEEPLLP